MPRQTGPERSCVNPKRIHPEALAKGGRSSDGVVKAVVGGYVPAVCGRDVTMARHPKPARTSDSPLVTRHFSRLRIEPVVTSKCASGRPLLIDSALPIEFRATYSKQTTEKFLTGARTHISIFNFSPFPTQIPAQLIQHHRYLTNPKRSNRPRIWPHF